jgi:hypothetical protein
MRECSVFAQTARCLFRFAVFLVALVAFIALMELVRAFRLAHAASPVLGWLVAAAAVVLVTYGLFKAFSFVADRRTLAAPPLPGPADPTFEELKESAQYFMHLFKRIGANPYLDDETRKNMRQQAYDMEEVLGHHPLADDLAREIAKGRQALAPVVERLRERARRLTRERMKFIVQDVVEPPFPVLPSVVMVYHQLAMVSDIVNTYLSRPALFEYFIVMRDTWQVMNEGRFLSLGQNLFEAVYTNTPPLGRAIDDIGPALTSMWLTRTIALVTMLRCEATDEWDAGDAVGRVEALTEETIAVIKQSLQDDVVPILKLRLRHSSPDHVTDSAAFSRSIVDGIAKALDTLVSNLRHRPAHSQVLLARRHTIHDEPLPSEEATREEVEVHTRVRRRRPPRGAFRIFRTFGQRLKYTIGPGRSG